MKAVLFQKHGDARVLEHAERPDPQPQQNEVRVQLEFAALNHLDIWVRNGIPAYPVPLPHVLGADGSGVVKELGPDAEGVSVGDRVCIFPALSCGQCSFCKKGQDNQCDRFEILGTKRPGTYGNQVLVPDQNILPLLDGFPMETAAAFPLAYLTAWHMLITRAKIQSQETVLIVGSSAGVGVAAVQIAKWKKARVLAVTSQEEKVDKIKSLGADEVQVIKDNRDFSKWARQQTDKNGVDVVFEHVGPATWEASVKSLSRYGRLVTCGATTGPSVPLDLRMIFSRDLSVYGAKMGTQKEFQDLSIPVFEGHIKPLVDRVFALEEASNAHLYLEEKKQIGKILLKHTA